MTLQDPQPDSQNIWLLWGKAKAYVVFTIATTIYSIF